MDADLDSFQTILDDQDKLRRDLDAIQKNEPARKEQNQKQRDKIISLIKRYCACSNDDFGKVYQQVINEDFIVAAIKERDFKKKKDDLELLVNYLGAKLESDLNKILGRYAGELKENIDDYLSKFDISASAGGKIGINATIPFDVKRAFFSGMAGLLTFGGLALWASTLGNLAGYILVAKGVGFLSALGISVEGAAAVMPFVTAIGGPVTLFIVAAILVAVFAFGILSGGWQKSIAKKLIIAYKEENALQKYEDAIEKFWQTDTKLAFNTAADAIEEEWLRVVEMHREMLDNYNENDIRAKITEIEEMKSFLADIPLEGGGYMS
jgi:hypothetical protein